MGALFAYLVSIAIFVGGGYAGLYVLAHSDEFHQQQPKPLKHVAREARRAPEPAVAPSTTVTKPTHEPPAIEPENQPASAENQIAGGKAENQTAIADANTPDVGQPVAPVASPAAEIAAEKTSPAEPSKIIPASTPDAGPAVAAGEAPGVTDNKSLAVVQEARAEEKDAPSAPPGKSTIKSDTEVSLQNENAVPAREPTSDTGTKTEKADKPAFHRATRGAQRTHTARAQRKLVKMVRRTIEFPDGHREVRLISPDRARSASAYESDSDDLF